MQWWCGVIRRGALPLHGGQTSLYNLAELKEEEEDGDRSENLKKGTDHSSHPHVSGGNETDRKQRRGDYECVHEGGGCRKVARRNGILWY